MVAKLVILLFVLLIVLVAAVIAAYKYFDNTAERQHEKDMFREKRDAELLEHEFDPIDRELEKEREK